ncbi:hypothetical protein SPRG_09192 [Saprolegnia parasitica CBS 223.65]|uniref:Uncharacterized protein n=2 Tax=Saprolegnia parasitica (strain CBS 223.65) TaxID=695850 RepID=A0A067CEX0_SAPPC|nr:hypothetical protein SPRG_09192 [Saprolegnia parasitica CBS 223.65]KDO25367.1 hypothetical protein SPRG_09192 [Saprolegnia parasitica CBS 223.65]|eukprot:XP_012204014.1 hypothetical protein SPRG_09192 [Saprolegnia parasitica CBS 223.65]
MGIKIRNDTRHDVLVIVFTYFTTPFPTLYYRKTLLIPAGERYNCPTWQSAVKIYAWEADSSNGPQIKAFLEKRFGRITAARLALAPIGGDLLDIASAAAELLGDSILDMLIHSILEDAIDFITGKAMDKMQAKIENADEDFEKMQEAIINECKAGTTHQFKTTMAKKTFLMTQNALFLRRQFCIHRVGTNQLEIDGAGMSWF